MRIHPCVLKGSKVNWQIPAVGILLLMLLAFGIPRSGSRNDDAAKAAPKVLTRAVVIARNPLPAGARIENSYLTVEERPEATLPDDTVSSIEEVLGKVTLGPIPANYPLSQTLLADAQTQPDKAGLSNYLKRTRVETAKRNTVAVALSFRGMAPEKGKRIALSVHGSRGGSALVVDEAWVEDVNDEAAYVRVSPAAALFLEEAKSLGRISYLVIPDEGPSPYKGQAINNIFELRKQLGLETPTEHAKNEKNAPKRLTIDDFQSFAWIPGGQSVYGVTDNGRIHVIHENGAVDSLNSYRFKFPNWNAHQEDEAQADPSGEDVQLDAKHDAVIESEQ